MISITPIKSAEGAAKYYTAAFNYYAGDATAMCWLGKGSEILSLSDKAVTKEQVLALLSGQLPDGTELKHKSNGKHRPGFDMTLSAPKSISVLIGLGADARLEKFHDLAVNAAVQYIEKEFAKTRINKNGNIEYHHTENFTIAAFRQPSSRANDPDVHTHLLTMNLTFDKNNKARSLASDMFSERGVLEELMRAKPYAGLIYRTVLANLLKDAGYKLESCGEGLFELAGFPEEVKREFSQRREEIEAMLKERNWSGGAASSAATLLTRNGKEEYDLNVLKKEWATRAQTLGFDAEKFVQTATHPADKTLFQTIKENLFTQLYGLSLHNEAREAIEVGIEVITQKTSVFSRRDLMMHAMMHTLVGEKSVTIEELNQALDAKITSESLYQAKDPYTEEVLLTTPWQLTLETETLQRIHNNQGIVEPIASTRFLMNYLKEYKEKQNFNLTPSQTSAIRDFLTCKDRFMAIQGYAGVGKTTLLKITHDIANEKGYRIRGITVGSSAANEMTEKSGIKTDVFPVVYGELKRAQKGSLEKCLFVVDEASMLSSPQGHELIKLIEQKGGRLYLVGDDAQLPSTKNGRIFGLSQEYGIQTAEVKDIIRQKNQTLKEAVEAAITGDVYEAVNKTSEVREYDNYDERIAQFAKQFLNLSPEVKERTLLFAPNHKNRNDITRIIRNELIKDQQLGEHSIQQNILMPKNLEEKQWHHARYYTRGDVIRFNINLPRYGIKSGDYLTVGSVKKEHIRNETLALTNSNNKEINFKLSALPQYKESKAGLVRYVEVYRQGSLELRENDKIMWTKNIKRENITNSECATVLSIKEKIITMKMQDGSIQDFDKNSAGLKHLDHGYVLTNYKAQGKDKMYGIGFIESSNKQSATLRNYYVEISRAIQSMTIITDDKQNLMRALSYNVDEKKSAIDFVSHQKASQHNDRFVNHENSLDLQCILDKKESKAFLWQSYEDKVKQYQEAKEQNNMGMRSKIAFEIIHNPKLYRLSKTRLSYSEHNYRQDALKLSHLRYVKTLNLEEKKDFQKIKDYVRTNHAVRQAISTHKNHATEGNLKRLLSLSDKRNALAQTIYHDIERYKKHLHQFSIGHENRLGLSAHKIDDEKKLACKRLEKLGQQAHRDHIRKNVYHFFSSSDENQKIQLGHDIKEQAKASHRHVIQLAQQQNQAPQKLWGQINKKAREYQDQQYRKNLDPQRQRIFDLAKEFKLLGNDMMSLWNEKDSLKEKEYGIKLHHCRQLREKIATQLMRDDPKKMAILNYFKISSETLQKNMLGNQFDAHVKTLKNNTSGIEAKIEAALEIALDIKGHYPKMKNHGLSIKKFTQYLRVAQRKERLENLSFEEKKSYKEVAKYITLHKESSALWKHIYANKENNTSITEIDLSKAILKSSQRDFQAVVISKTASKSLLKSENIDINRLTQHAKAHQEKEKRVDDLITERTKLFNQLHVSHGHLNPEAKKFWMKNFSQNNFQVNQILASKEAYSKINTDKLKEMDKQYQGLVDRYELNDITEKKLNNKTIMYTNHVDLMTTQDALMANPKETYLHIFGEPKTINSKFMKYSGGLVVTLSGQKAGLWYDFVNQEGGGAIDAIMREKNVAFKEALQYAAEITHTVNTVIVRKKLNQFAIKQEELLEKNNKIKSAKSIWDNAVDIKGTLAEKYLKEHRKITNTENLNIKILPKGSIFLNMDSEGNLVNKKNHIPALIIPATNKNGEITGVQRIYLDEKTGSKNQFMDNPKLSKGILKGSACIIQKGKNNDRLFIAEGPETAATLCQFDKKATVITSFGLGNMGGLKELIQSINPKQIIIAGDNDINPQIKTNTLKISQSFQESGYSCFVAFPEKIDNKDKTDWNDILVLKGEAEVKKQLENQIFKNENGIELNSLISKNVKNDMTNISYKVDTNISDLNKETIKNLSKKEINALYEISNKPAIETEKYVTIKKEIEREI